MNEKQTANLIVNNIWRDICGRSDGDHFLEGCDEGIQEEIKQSWQEIVIEALKEESSG